LKKHPKGQLRLRSQTEAMLQVAKRIESSAKQQEEMKDQRLETLLKSESQWAEMFWNIKNNKQRLIGSTN